MSCRGSVTSGGAGGKKYRTKSKCSVVDESLFASAKPSAARVCAGQRKPEMIQGQFFICLSMGHGFDT